MKTIEINRDNLDYWQKRLPEQIMALGFFDGLHKGHLQVIETAKKEGQSKNVAVSVMSFFPHPKSVLSDGKVKVDYLMPLEEKEKRLKKLGVDYFFVVQFDKQFASLSPEQFVESYLVNLGIVHAVCGFDYTYGHRGAGNMSRLKLDSRNRLEVTEVPKVDCYGEKISSTLIRESLAEGKVNYIHQLLGKPYQIEWNTKTGLSPFYTLPAPGRYYASIQGAASSVNGIVIVTTDRQVIFNQSPFSTEDQLVISWHYQVRSKACREIS